MKTLMTRLPEWFRGKQLPPVSLVWLKRFPLSYWQAAVIVLLTLMLALSLARLFWLLFTPNAPAPATAFAAPAAVTGANSGTMIDIVALKALDLFGRNDAPEGAVEQPQVAEPEVIAAEETKLALVLKGIVGSNQVDAARAIIANGNDQDIYAPGDKLPVGNQVTLQKILTDKVILNNSGRYESLLLYEEGVSAGARPQPRRTVAAPRPVIEIPESVQQALETGNVPASINDVIKLTVAREGSDIVGYRVRPGRHRQLFDELGFKTGDVVTHVNGIVVDDPAKAMAVYREVRGATSARFDIQRDGGLVTLEIDLADLDLGEGTN